MKNLGTAIAAMTLATASSHAAISVANSATESSANLASSVSSFTIPGFDLSGGNAIVVMTSGEAGSQYSDVIVTFGGEAMTNANAFDAEGTQYGSVNYLVNPSMTVGDVSVTFENAGNNAVTILSLTNVGAASSFHAFGEPQSSLPWAMNYSGVSGGFVVAVGSDNSFSGTGAPSLTGGNIDTLSHSLQWDALAGGSAGIVQGYGSIDTTGDFAVTFDRGGNSSSRNAGALVAFTEVPEPSVALLGGLGILGLLRRRRAA